MELGSILPIKKIESILGLPLSVVDYGFDEIERFIQIDPGNMLSASLRIWDRVVTHSNIDVDPMMLADHVNRRDPRMFEEISRIVGDTSIKDFHFAKAELEGSERSYRTAAQIAVAHTFPNDLLLMDILLTNPFKPIPPQQRVSEYRKFRGYGLLGEVVENLLQCAKELDCEAILLTAASIELMPVFEGHGFTIDDTPSGRSALERELGPPMHLVVRPS